MNKLTLILMCILYSAVSFSAANEQSFTPDSVLVPILEVRIPGGGTLFECAGTGDECLVDIADPAALTALTTDASINVGSHDTITVGTCKSEGEYTAKVRGSVVLGGTTYYTTSGADVLSTSVGDLDYTSVVFSGCSNDYTIPGGLTVTSDTEVEEGSEEEEGEFVDFNLFISLTDIAWANLSTATIPSGCKEGSNGSVCLSYPEVVPSVGTITPTLETYRISDTVSAANAGGQLLCIFDQNDRALGGFSRRYFSGTSQEMVGGFDTPFRSLSQNGDGTLNIENYGGSADSSALRFENFPRSSHTGTYSSPSGEFSGNQAYTATLTGS
ncbi:MAG: hypothetical protein ACRBBP_04355 [Bdellovibrionales bacterium]